MHLRATNMLAKHSMITPSPSSPQVRLRPLTNSQGKPLHGSLYRLRWTQACMSLHVL
jgi:hypothetical protein